MKINWFTVIAQVINFLLLVWLLRRFLYKPILDAIAAREKKITDKLADAAAKMMEAKKEQDEFNQKNATFDKQKADMLAKAVDESNKERQRLMDEANKVAVDLQTKLADENKKTQENLALEIAQKTEKEVFAMTSKTLADIASVSLDEQSAYIFIKHINELNDQEKNQFISNFKVGTNLVLVKSVFELSPKIQTEIRTAVGKILGTEPPFQFTIAPELISGIELTSNGYKLAWSISAYLTSLQKNIQEKIKENPEVDLDKK